MTPDPAEFADFLSFSSVVTGFNEFELRGTGVSEAYWSAVAEAVGSDTATELLQAFRRARSGAGGDAAALDAQMRALVLSDDKLGPVARNIIKLWYVGTWYQMPGTWRADYGEHAQDTTRVVSPAAYTEGLLWPTIGANPPGAKGPGYGTWSAPPRIPDI